MDLSLFYFADDATAAGSEKYRLLLDGARFADDAGLAAVWTPERHFHPFGGLYPNPSVTGAAVAAVTRRVSVRGGSVVLPLHDPIRVAEEWSIVDNISGGRAAVAFASGWHAVDFALRPDPPAAYAGRREAFTAEVDTVRRLWRGETVDRVDGQGAPVSLRIYPAPVQPELPFWITSSGNPDTFRLAGELGGNLLTHLLGQDLMTLQDNVAAYRHAYAARHGRPGGHVTLMLHTHVGKSDEDVLDEIRAPFTDYLASSLNLLQGSKIPRSATPMTQEEARFVVGQAFERYSRESGLFGSVDTARAMLGRLGAAGVDEVACLIDFGVDRDAVTSSFTHLADLVDAPPGN